MTHSVRSIAGGGLAAGPVALNTPRSAEKPCSLEDGANEHSDDLLRPGSYQARRRTTAIPAGHRQPMRAAMSAGMPGPGRTPTSAGSCTWSQLAQVVCKLIGPPQTEWT